MANTETHTFRYDPANEILENTLLGVRVIVWDAEFYKTLVSNLTGTFQTGTTVFLYHIGLSYGRLLGRRILESGGLAKQTELEYRQRYASLAIGKFHFPSLMELATSGGLAQITVRLRDSFFAKALGKTGTAECHIVRGLLEGTAGEVFKRDYQCVEAKCLSKGDEQCEFLISLRH